MEYNYKNLLEKSRELADKIITNAEWIDIDTYEFGSSIKMKSDRTGKWISLYPNETEESINKKLQIISKIEEE